MNPMTMWVALVELHPDETPQVILTTSKVNAEKNAAEMIVSLWNHSPQAFEDDGPEYMHDFLLDHAGSTGLPADVFLEGLRDATTVPFVTIFEQEVTL